MATSQRPLNLNMQRPRVQGWAAFDHKQKEMQGSETEHYIDPYPSISKLEPLGSAKSTTKVNRVPARPFSSVIRSSMGFPPFVSNFKSQGTNDISGTEQHSDQITGKSDVMPVKMLQDIHTWADQNLIQDVLTAVNNDVGQASALLKAMVSSDSNPDNPSMSGSSSSTQDKIKCSEENNFVQNKLLNDDAEEFMSKCSFFVPTEPEWEEDDVYLSHRKDSVKMMRVASQHSRAASNAFLRGDHNSAQQYSLMARDEWMTAERLNAEAAMKILSLRNSNNDIWKLDLHGLHASEAVNALKDRLLKIESELLLNSSASSDSLAKMEIDGGNKKRKEAPQKRQMILHVIAGKGNHSRGQASLPPAVKSFLIDNGYRFDDARPGVFAVRPKFRNK